MTTAAQVAKQAQQLGKQLQAVIEVGEFLEELGSLEQAISEAKRTNMAAFEQRVEAQKDLALTQEALDSAQANLRGTQVKVQEILGEANAASARSAANARKSAQETLATATAAANQQIDEATATVQRLETKRVALIAAIDPLRVEYTKLKKGLLALHDSIQVAD